MAAYKGFNVPAGIDPANVPQSFRNYVDSVGTSYASTAAADAAGVPDNYVVKVGTVMMYRLSGTWYTVVESNALNTSVSASAASTLAAANANTTTAVNNAVAGVNNTLANYQLSAWYVGGTAGAQMGGGCIYGPETNVMYAPRNGSLVMTVTNNVVVANTGPGNAAFYSYIAYFDYRVNGGPWALLMTQGDNGYLPAYFGAYSWRKYNTGTIAIACGEGASYQFRMNWCSGSNTNGWIVPEQYTIHGTFGAEVL